MHISNKLLTERVKVVLQVVNPVKLHLTAFNGGETSIINKILIIDLHC